MGFFHHLKTHRYFLLELFHNIKDLNLWSWSSFTFLAEAEPNLTEWILQNGHEISIFFKNVKKFSILFYTFLEKKIIIASLSFFDCVFSII